MKMENEITVNEVEKIAPAAKYKPFDGLFAWLSLVLGILFVRYVIFNTDGFFTTAVFVIITAFIITYALKCGIRLSVARLAAFAVILLFSSVFSLTDNVLIHALCFIFLFTAELWQTTALFSGFGVVTRFFPLDALEAVFARPFKGFGNTFGALRFSLSGESFSKKLRNILLIIGGTAVMFPLTLIAAYLLMSADSGVKSFIESMAEFIRIDLSDLTDILRHLIFGVLTGCFIFGSLYAGSHFPAMCKDTLREVKINRAKVLPNLFLYAGVTPLCALYLIYVVSQLSYFVSAFSGILPDAAESYAQYARQGFFELCAIAFIDLAVILAITAFSKNADAKALKVYACMLCLFTLFIISTALAKMVLYVDIYGLTPLRLYTSWFMVLMAAVFTVLFIRQFRRGIPSAAVIVTIFTVMFAALCFMKPDALIAEYNITRYEQGTLENLDTSMLLTLSDDAYVVMAEHYPTIKAAGCGERFIRRLDERVDDYSFGTYNISTQRLIEYRDSLGL